MNQENEHRHNSGAIKAYTASVDIVSGLDLNKTYQELRKSKLPIIYTYDSNPQNNGYILQHEDSEQSSLSISLDHKEVVIRSPRIKLRQGEVLFSAAYPLVESQLQNEGYLTCHAACVVLEDKGILLLGPNGSGKTSVVLELCKKYEAKLSGNNQCIIGMDNSLRVADGTKPITLRYSSVNQDHPEYVGLFEKDDKDPWRKKISVNPEEIGISTHRGPVNISSAYLLHVDNTLTDLYKDKANALDDKLYLYDNFSRIIRLTGMTPLLGDTYDFSSYFPSLDTPELYKNRIAVIGHLQDKLDMERLTGPLDRVVGYITEKTKGV
ncbi:MAG: hypothetical protein M1308_00160 [Actinobacteria bacterium]|nr:hypothetical protein [Actinomycetota bacterium]MCL5069310.1 hypothetical protein [Actinomycetota bacterium]